MTEQHSTEMVLLQILREVHRTRRILEAVHGAAYKEADWITEAIVAARDRELNRKADES